jgi:hypothetical protein
MGGAIGGDPHFVHPRSGKIYDVQARGGAIVNLVSNSQVQLNALFAEWEDGKTYMAALGICGYRRRIVVSLHDVCDQRMPGARHVPIRADGSRLRVAVGGQSFAIDRCRDHGLLQVPHLDIDDLSIAADSHGLYGQVVGRADIDPVPGAEDGEGVIEGVWEDYIVGDLLGSDFKFNRFVEAPPSPIAAIAGGRIHGC